MRIHGFYNIIPKIMADEIGYKEKETIEETFASCKWTDILDMQQEFIDILDAQEDSFLVASRQYCVSVASFLLGYCCHLALKIHNTFDYQMEVLEIDGEFVHMYCTYEKDGVKYYIDSRGITDSWPLFIAPFKPYEQGFMVKKIYPGGVEDYMASKDEPFKVDAITDKMCDWYMKNYGHYVSVEDFFMESGCH